jgi:hypothetical protein
LFIFNLEASKYLKIDYDYKIKDYFIGTLRNVNEFILNLAVWNWKFDYFFFFSDKNSDFRSLFNINDLTFCHDDFR